LNERPGDRFDSTVLIGYLRDTPAIASALRRRLDDGHTLATTCVNLAEVERGFDAALCTG